MTHKRLCATFGMGFVLILASGVYPDPGNAPPAAEAPADRELDACRARVAQLEAEVAELKGELTGTELLRRLYSEASVWKLVVTSRSDSPNQYSVTARHFDDTFSGKFYFELKESPGDLTVGDHIRVEAQLEYTGTDRRFYLKGAKIVAQTRPDAAREGDKSAD